MGETSFLFLPAAVPAEPGVVFEGGKGMGCEDRSVARVLLCIEEF